jgi:hypothetical protein
MTIECCSYEHSGGTDKSNGHRIENSTLYRNREAKFNYLKHFLLRMVENMEKLIVNAFSPCFRICHYKG